MRAPFHLSVGLLILGALAATAPGALARWNTVKLVLQEEGGETREVVGSKIAYGYFKREFTPGGVQDRLRVEKSLVFADRDIRFPDLRHILIEHEEDGQTGLLVPTVMHITYLKRRDTEVKVDRNVSELQGYGNPKPVVLILTTESGKLQFDLTPPYDEDSRDEYRPVLEIRFE